MKTYPVASLSGSPYATPIPLTNGLISCWEFDETSGTTAYDSHGSNDLTHGGSVQVNQTGKIGKAININTDVSTRTSASAFAGLTYCTVSAWTYFTGNLTVDRFYTLYAKQHTFYASPYWQFGCWIRGGAYDYYGLSVGNSITNSVETSSVSSVISNAWVHLIMDWDTVSGTMHIYINNVNDTIAGNNLTGTMGTAATPLKIGDDNDLHANILPWVGYIDQIAVWNRILSSDERAELYNSGSGLAYTSW